MTVGKKSERSPLPFFKKRKQIDQQRKKKDILRSVSLEERGIALEVLSFGTATKGHFIVVRGLIKCDKIGR